MKHSSITFSWHLLCFFTHVVHIHVRLPENSLGRGGGHQDRQGPQSPPEDCPGNNINMYRTRKNSTGE